MSYVLTERMVYKIADKLLKAILADFFLEESLDLIWRIRTDNITLDELYNLEPLDAIVVDEPPQEKNGVTIPSSSAGTVVCPICQELIGGTRFAPHLEKCMNGGKRGTRRYSEVFYDEIKPQTKRIVEFVDPHPKSLIVKIKLRNGEPYGNTKRTGVSREDFDTFCSEAKAEKQ